MITNITLNKIIANKIKLCNGIFSKASGLMFRKKLSDTSFIFTFDKEKIIPLHMLFVFQSIDVLFLDSNKNIVEIKENLKPFTFFTPKKKAQFVIELPAGSVHESSVGDSIVF